MNYSKHSNEKKRKRAHTHKKKVKNKVSIIIFRIFLAVVLIGGFALAGACVGAYMGIIEDTPRLESINAQPDIYPSVIVDEAGNKIDTLKGEENREYVTKEKIPKQLKDAFVAIEDERFYKHDGIDYKGMARAVVTNLTSDRTEGASTITQQLIKNNVLKIQRNTLQTKLKEQYLALEYEKILVEQLGDKQAAKDHVLEVYMNTVNMHHSLNGVQTAAQYYFNKDVSQLTLSECAAIAGITQNPAKYSPVNHPENNKVRQKMVLNKMLELSMITQSQYDEAMADDVYARVAANEQVTKAHNSIHSYYVDRVIQDVTAAIAEKDGITRGEASYKVYNGGLKITIPQDKKIQGIMDNAFVNEANFPKKDFEIDVQCIISTQNKLTGKIEHHEKKATVKTAEEIKAFEDSARSEVLGANDVELSYRTIPVPQPQAAMVVIDYKNGHVKAITGGRGEKKVNLALNRGTDSERQPGSVFKVLASYAPAIDTGKATAATVINDAPYNYKGYEPKNWYGGYKGPSTIRQGITQSMNIVTVKNMVNTGIEECFKYLENFGFTTLVKKEVIDGKIYSDVNPATSLGGLTHGVTQLEVAAAYGTIANAGVYVEPIFFTQVQDHDGKVIIENMPESHRVLKKQSAYILTDMMKDVLTSSSGTGGKAKLRNTKMSVSGKTGTTTDTKDLTFVGYTPYYVGSVWLGYDRPKKIDEDKGYHMYLWREVMEKIHEDLPVKDFERPDGVIEASMCSISGKHAISLCSADPRGNVVKKDLFMVGTERKDYCDVHVSATIDTVTKKKASASCPPENIKTVVGVREGFYGEGSDGKQYEIPNAWINGPECDGNGTSRTHNPTSSQSVDYYIDPIDGKLKSIPKPDLSPIIKQPTDNDDTRDNSSDGGTESITDTVPVPKYTKQPASTLPPEPPPKNNTAPELPVIDDPKSVDNF